MSGPAAFVAEHVGPVRSVTPVSGGDTHRAYRVALSSGEQVFAKVSAAPHPFEAEALGLQAMADADTPLVIPAPLAYDANHLVLPWLPPGPPAPDAALGEGLAALHRHEGPAFGFDVDGSCGATPQPNPWTDDWPTFFVAHRIQPLLAALQLRGDDAAAAEAWVATLPERLATHEAPSLVHGDLWSGNHLHTAGGHGLVDPAAHYAHREFELGMMTLFGGFRPAVYRAYRAAWPLASGWQDRVASYRIYHVLNHAVLFGGGYRAQAVADMARLS